MKRGIYCKSCFTRYWTNFTEWIANGRVYRTCNDCNSTLCMGYSK